MIVLGSSYTPIIPQLQGGGSTSLSKVYNKGFSQQGVHRNWPRSIGHCCGIRRMFDEHGGIKQCRCDCAKVVKETCSCLRLD